MTKAEFAEGVAAVRLAFDLDEVRKPVLAAWYGYGVEETPAAEWSRIVKKIILNEERFPQNFIRAVIAYRGPKTNPVVIERPPDMTPEDVEESLRYIADISKSIGLGGEESPTAPALDVAVLLSGASR